MLVGHLPSAILSLPAFVSRSPPDNSCMYPSWINRSLCSAGIVWCIKPLAQSRNETNSSWVNGADKSGFIFQICASGAAVQASHPATIKLTYYRAFPSGRLTSSNEGTRVLFHHDSSAAPQAVQTALPVCGTDGKPSSVELGIIPFLRTHLVFPCQPSECLAIHSAACCSMAKPLTTSVSPSGQRTSTTQPNPGLPFRATKAGRYSDISGICAYGAPVQAGRPTTIKPTDRNLRSMAIVQLRKPLARAWLLRVRWYSRRQLAASGSRKSARG